MVETFSQSATLRYTKGAGAPLYMPPEAFNDENPIVPQLDTWSAGVMFYEMLSGDFPFHANSLPALYSEIANKEPKPLPSSVPEALREIVSISLVKDALRRFQTSEKMSEALEKAWAELGQHRLWWLGAIGDEVRLGKEEQLRKSEEGRRNLQDEGQKRSKNAARRQRGSDEDNHLPELEAKQEKETTIKKAEQTIPEEGRRKESQPKRVNKLVWAGIAVAVLVAMIGVVGIIKLLTTNSPNAEVYFNRGKECAEKKDFNCAIDNYTKTIELNPQYAAAYFNRGKAYRYKGNDGQAIKDYDKAIELDPQDSKAYYNRGNAYTDRSNYDQAISDYDKAIELDQQDANFYYNRGLAYDNKGNIDQAIKDYDKAIELDPQDASVYYNRGLAYERLGQTKEAKADRQTYEELSRKK